MRFTLLFALILSCLPMGTIMAQEYFSVHQQAMESHAGVETSPDLIGDRSIKIQALNPALAKTSALNYAVYGFLPYWSSDDYLNYDLLSHIAAFSHEIDGNGNVTDDHGWPWNNMINEAHAAGVKVHVTATLFSPATIYTLITNETAKQNFFVNMRDAINAGNADGLNVDFEGSNSSGWHDELNAFMAELTAYMHTEIPGSEVIFDGPAVNWSSTMDLGGLVESCDGIFIMGYAFAGSWSSNTGANAPLTGGSINITNTVESQYAAARAENADKLILGLPYYGHDWTTNSKSAGAIAVSFNSSKFYASAQTGAENNGRIWDSQSQTPWYRYQSGNDWRQIWYDDAESLGLKYELAKTKGLRGVGMWALGYDEDRSELWQAISDHLSDGSTAITPDRPADFRIEQDGTNALIASFSADTNATGFYIYWGSDGVTFDDSVYTTQSSDTLSDLTSDQIYYVRVRAVNASKKSQPTEVLAGVPSSTPANVLIVNGFDRLSNNTRDYVRQHGKAIFNSGQPFVSSSNEAIYRNFVSLNDFEVVDWILGDESTADETFNSQEQDNVIAYLEQGGHLLASGSEIGWDLEEKGGSGDISFYHNYLKTKYVNDAPNGQKATHYTALGYAGSALSGAPSFTFDDGSHGTYDVDWPDAVEGISGGKIGFVYDGLDPDFYGGAGTYYYGTFGDGSAQGRTVILSTPFETVYPESSRFDLMNSILDFFAFVDISNENDNELPSQLSLSPAYPNPFDRETTIQLNLPSSGDVTIQVYDLLGRPIWKTALENVNQDQLSINWNGETLSGNNAPAGVYLIRAILTDLSGNERSVSQKVVKL